MASATSFKQQCPSCEAMVPIRDPKLIGRKIDCPKCKYRFVVEKPGKPKDDEDEDEDDTPAPTKKAKKPSGAVKTEKPSGAKPKGAAVAKGKPAARRRDEDDDEEDERPKKKKSGASMTVMLGAGLGVLALLLLAVGGFMMMGSGSSSNNSKSNSATPGNSMGATPPVVEKPPEKKPEGPPLFISDISNLLPNNAEAVVNLQIDKLYASGFRQAALGTPGAFNEAAFKSAFGFPLADPAAKDGVQRVVTALNHSNHWVFTVLRTLKPFNKEQLIANLQLQELPAVNGLTLYSVKRDLDSLSNLLIKANQQHADLQACLLDGQTLVFADPAPMQDFLNAKGKPPLLSHATAPPPPPSGFAPPNGSMPTGGSMMPTGSMPTGGSMMPTGSTPTGGSMPPSGATPPPSSMSPGGSMPTGGSMMPNGSMPTGGSMTPGGSSPPTGTPPPPPPPLLGSYLTIDPAMKALFDKVERPEPTAVLFSIVLSPRDPMLEELDRYGKDRVRDLQAAKGVKTDDAMLRDVLDKQKDKGIQDLGARLIGVSMTAFSQDKAGGAVALAMPDENVAKTIQAFVQPLISTLNTALAGGAPAGPGIPTPGGSIPSGGSIPPAGSFNQGGATPPPSSMSPGGSMPSGGSMTPGGSFPPNGTMPGSNPSSGPQGPVYFTVEKETLVFSATLPITNDLIYQGVEQEVAGLMVHLKGAADMVSTRSRVHDMAAALQKYVKDKGHFPRGTADRPLTAERFIDWAPNQRVSWMAELLPYVGDGEYAGLPVDPTQSWQDGDNLHTASVLVAPFIGRSTMPAPPVVHYPGVPQSVATTSFVGVSGVGMDAAEYTPDNPKAGVFGYYRETKPADVKDGLDKTIVLLQVPPELKDPWLAGGGATVRGVSEGPDAVRPFVCVDYQGKHGTFAVMGDGKVRFISETMDPNIFRALCTAAGGEKIDDLDKVAPVVPGDQTELHAEAPPGPPPAAPPPPPGPPPAGAPPQPPPAK